MMNTALLETLESLTPAEQKALLAVAKLLKSHRDGTPSSAEIGEALLAELPGDTLGFRTPDADLSPARAAARRFMRENPTLMGLLAR